MPSPVPINFPDRPIEVTKGSCLSLSADGVVKTFDSALKYELSWKFFSLCGPKPKFEYDDIDTFVENLQLGTVRPLPCFHPLRRLQGKSSRYLRFRMSCTEVLAFIFLLPFYLIGGVFKLISYLLNSLGRLTLDAIVKLILGPFVLMYYAYKILSNCDQKTNTVLLRSCERLAYSVGRVNRGNFKTCLVIKILSFQKAVELLQRYVQESQRQLSTDLTPSMMRKTVSIRDRMLREQSARLKLEIAVPQMMFVNIFGEKIELGDTNKKYFYPSVDAALGAQLKLLQSILKKAKRTKDEEEVGVLDDGIPVRLRNDIVTLLGSTEVNFNIKPEQSIINSFEYAESHPERKDENGNVKLKDLVRCRALVSSSYDVWRTLLPRLAGNLSDVNCQGIVVDMQAPKTVDLEDYTEQMQKATTEFEKQVLNNEYQQVEWYGLYLYLFYDGLPVEVQVMTFKSMLHAGTDLSHEIRDVLKRVQTETLGLVRGEVTGEPPMNAVAVNVDGLNAET